MRFIRVSLDASTVLVSTKVRPLLRKQQLLRDQTKKPPGEPDGFLKINLNQKAYAAAVSGFVYLRRTGLVIMPLRMALVLTLMRTIRPLMTARTF